MSYVGIERDLEIRGGLRRKQRQGMEEGENRGCHSVSCQVSCNEPSRAAETQLISTKAKKKKIEKRKRVNPPYQLMR